MSTKVHRNKIGARYLTDNEARLILPTYDQIYEQIKQFRREKQDFAGDGDTKTERQDIDQKTNNIGIIGVRGAGKTSVLKTIQTRLKKESAAQKGLKDIILPIIVPENMSECSTLMATILGTLGSFIKGSDSPDAQARGASGRNEDCIRLGKCQEKYGEVIKQYTYIQKEYRDILLHEYTTENTYVESSAKVFNSDTEFIRKFNELIDLLLNRDRGNDRLLFLFIDDIDLSTYRCADVVRTLLSYLSNRNIVTFISGDLETFEEALTLDFLRQEQVLHTDMLGKDVGSRTILDSKKMLAYEYLKKILPPVFRHNIKHWSLEEKGNYCVSDEEDEGKTVTLSWLLETALEDWVDPAFFRYAQIKEDSIITEEGDIQWEEKALPYTYHLFDDTSRGLNNVYNVLREVAARRKEDGTGDCLTEKKLLLDTIISSKPVYNQYRDEIQKNMFTVGAGEGKVYFDNAKEIIYKIKTEDKGENTGEEKGGKTKGSGKAALRTDKYAIADPVERFSLFLFVDFAARLLYGEEYDKITREEGHYILLKQKAMEDLFFCPVIAEKVMVVPDHHIWESKDLAKIEDKKIEEITLPLLNKSFLLKGNLVLNLAYYKNLSLEEVLQIYRDEKPVYSVELEQKTIIAVWKAFASMAEVGKKRSISEQAAVFYPVFWKEFAYIQSNLSGSAAQNSVIRLFSEECEEILKKEEEDKAENRYNAVYGKEYFTTQLGAQVKQETDRRIRQEKKRLLLNTIAFLLEDEEKRIEIHYDKEMGADKNTKRRLEVLKAIDSANLWHKEVAQTAITYIKETTQNYFIDVLERLIPNKEENEELFMVNTNAAEASWIAFQQPQFGASLTVAKRIRNEVLDVKTNFDKGMCFADYHVISGKFRYLAGNYHVWYGRSEAQKVLNSLQDAFIDCSSDSNSESVYITFLLQCLYKYKMATDLTKDTISNALLLVRVRKDLEVAHTDADKEELNDFIFLLNQKLESDINVEDFEKLFESGK